MSESYPDRRLGQAILAYMDPAPQGATQVENLRHFISRVRLTTEILKDAERLKQLLDQSALGLEDFDLDGTMTAVALFVRDDLGLDMPWLARDLTCLLFEYWPWELENLDVGKWFLERVRSQQPRLAPPLPSLPEGWCEGLTREEALERKRKFDSDFEEAFAPTNAIPIGRWRKDVGRMMANRVRWFYRARVRRESHSSIARSEKRDRRDIVTGVAMVQACLALSPWRFADLGE